MAITLVQTVSVGSGGASSIAFTNIPQTGKDLFVLFSVSSTSGSNYNDLQMLLNGSGSFFNSSFIQSNGTSIFSGNDLFPSGRGIGYGSGESGYFTNGTIHLPNYAISGNKSYDVTSVFSASSTPGGNVIAGLWSNTAAITSVEISYSGNTLRQHSTASLYIIS